MSSKQTRGDALTRRGFLGLFAILALLGAACSSLIQDGTGTLPSGIDSAMVPDAELGGYIYFSSVPPIAVSSERFLIPSEAADLPPPANAKLQLSRATIAISEAPKDFSGTLEFADVGEAQTARDLYQARPESANFWGVLDAPKVHIVHGESPWALNVRAQVDSGNMVSIEDSDPLAWDLLTNLPESTEKPPLVVGALTLGGDMLKDVTELAGVQLFGLDTVFGFVGVHNVAFGIYADASVGVPDGLNEEFFKEAEVAIVMVSNPGYPGIVVSFLLKMVSGRAGMESIEIGDTAARYRTVNDLHLIVKNKGSLLYTVVASTRSEAERLVLSAIED